MSTYLHALLPRRFDAGLRRVRAGEALAYLEANVAERLGLREPAPLHPLLESLTVTVLRWETASRGPLFARFWGGRQSRRPVLRHAGAVREFQAAGVRTPELLFADDSFSTALRWGFECTVETAAPPVGLGPDLHASLIPPLAEDLARLHARRGERWGRPWVPGASSARPPLKLWQAKLERMARRLTPESTGLTSAELATGHDLIRRQLPIQAAEQPVLIHGDLFANHVRIGENGSLTWIDLETVQYGLPEWDLGNLGLWVNHDNFQTLVAAYESARGAAFDRDRLRGAVLYAHFRRLQKRLRKARLREKRGGGPTDPENHKRDPGRVADEIRTMLACR